MIIKERSESESRLRCLGKSEAAVYELDVGLSGKPELVMS